VRESYSNRLQSRCKSTPKNSPLTPASDLVTGNLVASDRERQIKALRIALTSSAGLSADDAAPTFQAKVRLLLQHMSAEIPAQEGSRP
jgi:hypothetical protein